MTVQTTDLPGLPASARVWIYGAERALEPDEIRALEAHMSEFLAEWHSHGREVTPSWRLVHGHFVIIGVDEAAARLSGCSIDSMVHALAGFSRRSGLSFTDSGSQVFYRAASGEIRSVDRSAFADLAREGRISEETPVFDNTIARLDDLRSGRWEVPMRESWHMQVFGRWLPSSSA